VHKVKPESIKTSKQYGERYLVSFVDLVDS